MRTLTLQVTEVSFDFEDSFDEPLTDDYKQEVLDSVVGNVFEVEVDDDANDDAIADVLVEEVTDYTGWCVFSLDFVHVLNTH
jgi:hypothetical protein